MRAETLQQTRGHLMSEEDLLRAGTRGDNPGLGGVHAFVGTAAASENAPVEDENSRIMANSNHLVHGDAGKDGVAADALAIGVQASAPS